MLDNNDYSDKDLEINKEDKYRDEIFHILKSTFEDIDSEESVLFYELFLNEPIDNNQLLKLITSLK